MGNIGILVIDMQPSFLPKGDWDTGKLENQIEGIQAVMKYGFDNNLYTLFIETGHFGDKTIPELSKLPGSENCPKFIKVDMENNDSAFAKLGFYLEHPHHDSLVYLEEPLRSRGISTLVVMGVNMSSCVGATAKDAREYGFKIVTSRDLIEDYNPKLTSDKRVNRKVQRNFNRHIFYENHQEVIDYLSGKSAFRSESRRYARKVLSILPF